MIDSDTVSVSDTRMNTFPPNLVSLFYENGFLEMFKGVAQGEISALNLIDIIININLSLSSSGTITSLTYILSNLGL